MQKFKHNNTNIWIWKYCLLKIYLNTESWWIQVVDSRGMTLTQRKVQEKIFELSEFLHSLIFFCSWSYLFWTLEPLPDSCSLLNSFPNSASGRSLGVLFIAEALGFKKALFLWFLPRVWRLQKVRFFSSSSFLSHGYWVTFLLFTFES